MAKQIFINAKYAQQATADARDPEKCKLRWIGVIERKIIAACADGAEELRDPFAGREVYLNEEIGQLVCEHFNKAGFAWFVETKVERGCGRDAYILKWGQPKGALPA